MPHWTLLTGEYPPKPGGVSDYTRIVAENLAAANDTVEVWAPRTAGCELAASDPRIRIRWLPDHFGRRSLAILDAELAQRPDKSRILVQYVPHAFGQKAMNVAFCHWLFQLGRRREVWSMFHEVAYPMARRQPLRHNLLAGVNTLMAMMVARASQRIFISIPAWTDLLRPLTRSDQIFEWMPIPSNIPAPAAEKEVSDIRMMHGVLPGDLMIGHFGTYSQVISILLRESIVTLLASPRRHAMFVGRGGIEFAKALATSNPELTPRLHALGGASPERVSAHLAACDLMIQPYPDGVTCRRGTTMAGLALGLPIVTNLGPRSESIWELSNAVALAVRPDPHTIVATAEQLLADPSRRFDIAARARRLYLDKFDIRWTIQALRGEPKASHSGEFLVQ